MREDRHRKHTGAEVREWFRAEEEARVREDDGEEQRDERVLPLAILDLERTELKSQSESLLWLVS